MTDKPEPPEEIYVQHFDGVFVHQPPRERDELCADDHELSYYCDRNNFVKYIRADVAETLMKYILLKQKEVGVAALEVVQDGLNSKIDFGFVVDQAKHELREETLTELTQSSQEMGLYDHIGQVDKMISPEEKKARATALAQARRRAQDEADKEAKESN